VYNSQVSLAVNRQVSPSIVCSQHTWLVDVLWAETKFIFAIEKVENTIKTIKKNATTLFFIILTNLVFPVQQIERCKDYPLFL
jgi:hypothetical protein